MEVEIFPNNVNREMGTHIDLETRRCRNNRMQAALTDIKLALTYNVGRRISSKFCLFIQCIALLMRGQIVEAACSSQDTTNL